MKSVNLIFYNNGVGLVKDSQVIKDTLNGLCNEFQFYDFDACRADCPDADINIFLQSTDEHTIRFIPKAKKNILIPNMEWFIKFGIDNISKLDCIFAKSQECKSVLDKYHNNVVYTGFSSIDRWVPSVKKTNKFLHFAGKSIQKYTELVVDVFSELRLPITIVDSTKRFNKLPKNINYITTFLSEKEVNEVFNSHSIHICCSLSEGWGHYIYEALSCKSVVVINNCSPENELLTEEEVFIVKTTNSPTIPSLQFKEDKNFPLRKFNYTDRKDLVRTARNLDYMSDQTLSDMGNKSREAYIRINNSFKAAYKQLGLEK